MKRLLFVCLGNICRSPAAQAIMEKLIREGNLGDKIQVDSAGTSGWHEGKPADPRMQAHGRKRGFDLTSLSRPFVIEDFERWDLILCMDRSNYQNVIALATSDEDRKKIRLMCESAKNFNEREVPDPYYGGDSGFEHVFDLLEDACRGLLEELSPTGL